jgi:hypothetical protein
MKLPPCNSQLGSHSRTGRLQFRRHRRQGIDPKFFDSWSRTAFEETSASAIRPQAACSMGDVDELRRAIWVRYRVNTNDPLKKFAHTLDIQAAPRVRC